MKTKKFKIKIQSLEDFKGDFGKAWKAAERGGVWEPEYDLVLSFQDASALSRVFSPERIRIIQTVREKKPNSIRELARILKRSQPNVQKDVQDLADLGILELRSSKDKGSKQAALVPFCPWDEFDVAV
jgi:predicted transcriptional regulator